MKRSNHSSVICLLCCLLLLSGCAAKKKIAATTPVAEPVVPTWQTALVQSANLNASLGSESLSANCQMQVVHDSMLTISVMPLLGIEALRVEATPDSVWILDKLNRRYTVVDYVTVNQWVTPSISWNDLQDLASGALLAEGQTQQQWGYAIMGQTARLTIQYGTILKNVPVHPTHIRTNRYTRFEPVMYLRQ